MIKEWWFKGELANVIYCVQLVTSEAWLCCFRHDLHLLEFAHGAWLSGNSRCGSPTKYYQVCLLLSLFLVNTCVNQVSHSLNLPTLLHTWSLGNWTGGSNLHWLHYSSVHRRNVATKTTLGILVIQQCKCLCLFCQLSNKCTGQLQKTLTLTRLFHCQPLVNLPVKVLSSW